MHRKVRLLSSLKKSNSDSFVFGFLGKNDGSVQGVRYFTSRQQHGMFVRANKLKLDRRGRAMRMYRNESQNASSRGRLLRDCLVLHH